MEHFLILKSANIFVSEANLFLSLSLSFSLSVLYTRKKFSITYAFNAYTLYDIHGVIVI